VATSDGKRKNRHYGRHAKRSKVSSDAPGGIFLLSIVGAVPIVVLFLLGPLFHNPAESLAIREWVTWRWFFYVVTPAASVLALWYHRKAADHVKYHNAAIAGRRLAFANLACWVIFGAVYAWLFVLR
jgi:hypothetical protein